MISLGMKGYPWVGIVNVDRHVLEKVAADPAAIDVVIVHMGGPSMDGLAILDIMRKDAAMDHIPVLLLDDAPDSTKAELLKALDAVLLPRDLPRNELFAEIAKAVDVRRAT